jgi:chemotaxis protein MotB
MTAELDACNGALGQLDDALEQCKGEVAVLQAARDEVLADNTALRAQLRELGADLDDLSQARSTLSLMLADAERALADARDRQAAADARDAIYRELKERLQEMIDAGKLNVRILRGRMVIDLKQDILFPSGKAALSDLGAETLREVSRALAEFSGRKFQVEGHTDNIPIKTSKFSSNWELSTARAVAVVKLFIDAGMDPDNLSAAGFGEFQPRADNASEEGRALNRRIEVVMVPDLQLLPDLVDSL